MRILIDADGCPVVDLTIRLAQQFAVEVLILCDTAHLIEREGASTLTFAKGKDSVDFALVNLLHSGDIVITQDLSLIHICHPLISDASALIAVTQGPSVRPPRK